VPKPRLLGLKDAIKEAVCISNSGYSACSYRQDAASTVSAITGDAMMGANSASILGISYWRMSVAKYQREVAGKIP
jgi:hypothetical protein